MKQRIIQESDFRFSDSVKNCELNRLKTQKNQTRWSRFTSRRVKNRKKNRELGIGKDA